MNFGLASTPMVSSSFMRREYNKKLGYFTFSSLGSTVMHCRMLESHYLNLGVAVYYGVEQCLYDNFLECKVGNIDLLLKPNKAGAYIKRIWITYFWAFSQFMTKLSKSIVCDVPCRGSLHLREIMVVQVRR